jgi:hypothetical protein
MEFEPMIFLEILLCGTSFVQFFLSTCLLHILYLESNWLFETFSCSFKLLSCLEQAHREAFIWMCDTSCRNTV